LRHAARVISGGGLVVRLGQGGQDQLPIDVVWKIHERTIKFIKISTDNLAQTNFPARYQWLLAN